MSSYTKFLFLMTAMLMIASGQIFGLASGYICQCHDEPVLTSRSHCHDHEDPSVTHAEVDTHPCETEPHSNQYPTQTDHHKVNLDPLEVTPISKFPSAPMPSVVPIATWDHPKPWLLLPLVTGLNEATGCGQESRWWELELITIPSTSHLVTSTTVILH